MQHFFFFLTSSITEFVNITRVCSSEPIESALPIQQYDGGELPKRKKREKQRRTREINGAPTIKRKEKNKEKKPIRE